MGLREAAAEQLIDSAEQALRMMRSTDPEDNLRGFATLQAIYSEMMDRHRSRFNYAPTTPLSGLAQTIADAMWDQAGNRIGGPRTAAEAVQSAGWRRLERAETQPQTTRIPPMWGLYFLDPSGKYGTHKPFFEHGETAAAAQQSALARYKVAGTTIDQDHPPFLAQAAQERPVRSEGLG